MKISIITILLLTICTAGLSAGTYPDDVNVGNTALEKYELDKALEFFTSAIKTNPYQYEAYLGRGKVYNITGKYAEALIDLNEAVKIKPKEVNVYLQRAEASSNLNRPIEAEKDFAAAISLETSNGDIYSGKAFHELNYNKYNEAAKDFRLSSKLKEHYFMDNSDDLTDKMKLIYIEDILTQKLNASNALYLQDKYEDALNELIPVINNKYYKYRFYLNFEILITAFKVSGSKYNEVLTLFKQANAFNRKDGENVERPFFNYVLFKLSPYTNASMDVEEAKLINTDNGSFYKVADAVIGYTYLLTGDRVKAREFFLKFKEKDKYKNLKFTYLVDKELSLLK